MSIEKYDPIRVIGEGSFGKVYLMRDKVKRNFLCVKVIKVKNIPKKEREATKMEVDLLKRLHHPNIVRYHESFLSRNNEVLCICMEYCDGGDLASQIKAARRNLFSESKILHWFVQMSLGLHYMHSNRVLHRDLKTQNVFLLGNGRLVLGDLGISKVLDGTMDFAQTCIGTPYYMSPEIFQNKPYSYKSDVWALGCMLYEMTTLNHAFDANSLNGLACKIVKGRYPPIHHKYSRFLRELIASMLLINPTQRPDLDQILRKPFIRKHVVNFFTDIASRPTSSIGEGTMIVRGAVGGNMNSQLSNDPNMMQLQRQLADLDMTQAVQDALKPKQTPVEPEQARKIVKEQASALRREEDHKKMVEAALEKLRSEREARLKQRQAGPVRAVRGMQNPLQPGGAYAARRQEDMKPAAARQPVASQASNAKGSIGAVSVAGGKRVSRHRRQSSENDYKDIQRESNANANANAGMAQAQVQPSGSEKRRSDVAQAREKRERQQREEARQKMEDARQQARVREQAREREEALKREEMAAKERLEEMRKEEARMQADAASRRSQARERERQKQLEEIEKLKQDQIKLNRLTEERERARRAREEAEEKRRVEQNRIGRQYRVGSISREPSADNFADAKAERVSLGGRGGQDDGYGAEDKYDHLNARERVLARKQAKQAADEREMREALRAAEEDNRRFRRQAEDAKRRLYEGQGVLAAGVAGEKGIGGQKINSPPSKESDTDYENAGFAVGRKSRAESLSENATPRGNDLVDRLNDATRGQPSRFEKPSQSNNPSRRSSDAQRDAQRLRNDFAAASSDASDDDRVCEDSGDHFEPRDSDENDEEVEEDLAAREEELRNELTYATMRCHELQQSLQQTKQAAASFVVPKPVPKNGHAHAGAHAGQPLGEFDDYDENEEDDEYDMDSDSEGKSSDDRYDPRGAVSNVPPRARGLRVDTEAGSERSYKNLEDPPTPSGKITDRIDRLRQRCIDALGRDAFRRAYNFLKEYEDTSQGDARGYYDYDGEEDKKQKVDAILGRGKEVYTSLIEQLIFMEDAN